ncbi:MAG: hypothetical protein CVU11_10390 [Bacteroidetes bacterium HGW-Bacteroidetes-6]|jgi:hypothetical protein|nr:MAG: hypothetical protein CVU11_10390 [Bacteroidetes bacterium HGW-Bacteroidetes-6]
MKSKLLILAVFSAFVLLTGSCGNKQGNDKLPSDVVDNPATADGREGDLATMSFETIEHDFGDIMQGEKVEYNFKFTNTGKGDLVITSHATSCGCTVPEYPKGAIAPGEGGVITVAFNSSGKTGRQNKTVTLSTNGQPRDVVLTIKATIIEP